MINLCFSPNLIIFIDKMHAKVLLTTHCARLSLIGPLDLADMGHHIRQSVSIFEYYPL